MIQLTDLFGSFSIQLTEQNHGMLSEATIDSRRVIPGSIFFAIKGERVDGHAYVPQAVAAGAQVVVMDHETRCDFPVLDI